MKIFEPLYEVYRRCDKTIVAQGTHRECEDFVSKDWGFSMRLAKEELYTKDDLECLTTDLFSQSFILAYNYFEAKTWWEEYKINKLNFK